MLSGHATAVVFTIFNSGQNNICSVFQHRFLLLHCFNDCFKLRLTKYYGNWRFCFLFIGLYMIHEGSKYRMHTCTNARKIWGVHVPFVTYMHRVHVEIFTQWLHGLHIIISIITLASEQIAYQYHVAYSSIVNDSNALSNLTPVFSPKSSSEPAVWEV